MAVSQRNSGGPLLLGAYCEMLQKLAAHNHNLYAENLTLKNEVCQLRQEIQQIRRQPLAQLQHVPEQAPQQRHQQHQQQRKRKSKENLKPIVQLSKAMRCRRKRKIEATFREATTPYKSDIQKVTIDIEFQGGKRMCFSPTVHPDEEGGTLQEKYDENKLHRLLTIKDRYRVSDTAMHELHMLYPDIPPKNQIFAERNRLSKLINIQESVSIYSAQYQCQYIYIYTIPFISNTGTNYHA